MNRPESVRRPKTTVGGGGGGTRGGLLAFDGIRLGCFFSIPFEFMVILSCSSSLLDSYFLFFFLSFVGEKKNERFC